MKKNSFIIFVWIVGLLLTASIAGAALPNNPVIKVRDKTSYDSTVISYYFVNQFPDPAEPGQYVEVRWRIENLGLEPADNVTFEILPDYPFSIWPGTSTIQKFGRLYSGQIGKYGVTLYYKLKIAPDAPEGNNQVRLRYKINDGEWVELDPFLIRIKTSEAILNVENISITPAEIKPGQKAQIIVWLKNNADSLVKDVTMKLVTENTPFTTVSSINTKSIKLLKAGNKIKFTYDIIADNNAKSGVYKLPLELSYKNEAGELFTKDGSVGAVIYDKPVYMAYLEKSDIIEANSKGKVYISISNMGTSEIKFLRVKLLPSEDYQILSSPTVYLGNIDSDDYETADFEIYVGNTDKKNIELPIEIEYSDELNNNYKETNNQIKVHLYSATEKVKLGLTAPSKFGGIGGTIIKVITLVLVVVFMLFMLIECFRSKRPGYQKILWGIVILTGVGALIYFFLGRKKEV